MSPTRWGIAGCGKISSDFANALQHAGPSNHVIVAVAARSLASAEEFGRRFGALRWYDCYEKLGQDDDIDAVYVGTVNATHFPISSSLLMTRKAVLCEKPMCVSAAQTEKLVALAKKHNTFLMEGIWSRHFPVYEELRQRLAKQEMGDLKHAFVTFGVPIANVPSVRLREYCCGSVFAIGVYALQFCLLAFGDEAPIDVQAMGSLNDEGVEEEVCVNMEFPGQRYGSCVISTNTILPNEAVITGTKGTLKMSSFWSPTSLSSPSGIFEVPLDPSDRVYNFENSQGLKYQADEVARCLREGRTESATMPLSSSLLLAEIMQTVRHKIGAPQF